VSRYGSTYENFVLLSQDADDALLAQVAGLITSGVELPEHPGRIIVRWFARVSPERSCEVASTWQDPPSIKESLLG
jgi:hypothetical protein